MNNATRTLSIVFATLLVLSAANYLFTGKRQSKALSTEIVAFDSSSVNQIKIYRPNKDAVELSESGGKWKVKSGENMYDADLAAVEMAISTALDLKIKSVLTRQEDKYPRFQVDDSSGTVVEFMNDGKMLSKLIVGKFNFVSQTEFNTYVRNANQEEVFAVDGFVGSSYNKDIEAWRNKKVWNQKDSEVTEIAVNMPADSSFTITRVGSNVWVSGVDTVKTSNASAILRNVARLNAMGFIENRDVTSLGQEMYSVKVSLDNGSSKTVKVYPHPEDQSKFMASATDFPYVFTLNKSSWRTSVLKDRTKLKE